MSTHHYTFTIVTDTPPEQVEDQAILILQPILDERGIDTDTIESRCAAMQQLAHTWCQAIVITLTHKAEDNQWSLGVPTTLLEKLTEAYKLVYIGNLSFHEVRS